MQTKQKWAAVGAALLLVGAGCFSTEKQLPPDGGVYKSSDAGAVWVQANAVPTNTGVASLTQSNVSALVQDPHHSGTLYAQIEGEGLMVSNDSAASWRRTGNIGKVTLRDMAIDPVEPCTLYASSGSRIHKSKDCGRLWSSIYEVPDAKQEVRSLAIAPNNRSLIYAGLNDGVLIVSRNGGGSWQVLQRFKSRVRKLLIDPVNPSRMYAVTEKKGIMKSDDAGATFNQIKEPLQAFTGYKRGWDLHIDPQDHNRLLYASTFGVLLSTDGGEVWNPVDLITAPGEARIYDIAVNAKNQNEIYYSAVVGGKALLYKTVDGGINWKTIKLPTTRVPVSIHIHSDDPLQVFIGMYLARQ